MKQKDAAGHALGRERPAASGYKHIVRRIEVQNQEYGAYADPTLTDHQAAVILRRKQDSLFWRQMMESNRSLGAEL